MRIVSDDRRRIAEDRDSINEVLLQVAREWTETFDAVAMPIVMMDPELRVRRLNRAAARLAGAEFRDILERRIDAVGPGEPWITAARLGQTALDTHATQTAEVRDEPTGMCWDISVSVANVNTPGDERIVFTARDVTAVRNLQESVRRAELLATLGSLVGGVAHEVRNPLFGLSATFEALAAEHRDIPSIRDYLGPFRHDLNRLKRLMNDLLEYGKPSKLMLVAQPLLPLLQDAVKSSDKAAKERGVSIVIDSAEDLPLAIVDAERIGIVFTNLIENALAFTPEGGSITLAAAHAFVNSKSRIICSVADSGPGFTTADLKRVFEPFYSRRSGGTGLGLALVQRIVTGHGGTVSARNRDGHGASIEMILPAEEMSRSDKVDGDLA